MRAFIFLGPVNAYAVWSLVLIAVVAAGIGPLASWRKSSRVSRGLVAALVAGCVFAYVGFDCSAFGGWVPDWLCYAF
jgi:ABC-type Mn2+/Zn2+ transport system permease subunit